MFLSDLSIKRPVFATVLMLSLLVLGIFSYRRLSVDFLPDIEIPIVSISIVYPGASSEAVEREVTKIVEEAVNPIPGVRHIQSTSKEGLSFVFVEFELETKLSDAMEDVRTKISSIRKDLPKNIEEPLIQKFDISAFPVVSIAVSSEEISPVELTKIAERRIKRRIEGLPGVGKVKIVGGFEREVQIEVDPKKLEALGIGINEVISGISSENINFSLGNLKTETQQIPLRILGKPKNPEEYASMVITSRGGHPVRLSEIANVYDGIKEQKSVAYVNGEPAIVLDVLKQSKANTVSLVKAVKKEVEELKKILPPSLKLEIVLDYSKFIVESILDVQETIIIGAILTVIIVFLFLNSWRSTVITGLTLPVSIISSFIAMYFLGMTLNIMTLMALSLAVGLLIDDAIVVRENIVRHMERGKDHYNAAKDGTSEIGLAVMATTFSILAVFIPIAFMKGIVGRFFFHFGLTIAFAVSVSLLVAFTLDPMLSSRWYDPDIHRKGKRKFLNKLLDGFGDWFENLALKYKEAIKISLKRRKMAIFITFSAFLLGAFTFFLLPSEFIPSFDREEFIIGFQTSPSSSIENTKQHLFEILEHLKKFKEITLTYAAIGAGEGDTVRDGRIVVKLLEKSKRKKSQKELMSEVRKELKKVPGITLSIMESSGHIEKPFQMSLKGDDLEKLKNYGKEMKKILEGIPGFEDIDVSMEYDLPEYKLKVDREKAYFLGVSSLEIASLLNILIEGQEVTTYEDEEGEAVNLRVRLPRDLRKDVEQIKNLKISRVGEKGVNLIPLANLIDIEIANSPSDIPRKDMYREVQINANLDKLPLGKAAQIALKKAKELNMEPGYRASMAGDTERMMESFGYLFEALILSIIFVFLILSAQFESFLSPLSIMFSLPLSIIGMTLMLLIVGDSISIMSLIGLILLMGLVTKNAILLVDFTNNMRRKGMSREDALAEAGRIRLRPIVMTTLAMIFGMLPLALELGKGAEMRAPMARAVIGGLLTSTFLTLFVVPIVYTILEDIVLKIKYIFKREGK